MGVYPKSLNKYQHYLPGPLMQQSYLLAYRCALLSSSAVIVLTEEMKKQYLKYFPVEEDKIRVLPNAIDLETFESKSVNHTKNARHSVRKELGLPSDTKIVSMVGRLDPEKDWLTFFRVASRVEENIDEPLAFLAVGSGSQETRLREYVRSRSLRRVFFLGYRNDVANLLFQSDVFLLTSRSEPFGIVILEAMAAACPVIATRSGGPESIITDGVTGLLGEVQDVQGLSAQVLRLLHDEKMRGKIISSARKSVEDNYTIDKVSNQMAVIYNKVIARG
jgi:glycosyltransferase involved in cell wall biosynthesis